jgi:XRE family transcriptional regulator of biofilm formation
VKEEEEGLKLGELIHALREDRGMSLGDLEKASGVGKGYIWELEQGAKDNPSVEIIQKISRALDVPASKLLGEPAAGQATADALPRGLKEFLEKAETSGTPVPAEDISMLQQIRYRGKRPRSAEDWALLYDFIRHIVR